MTGGDETNVLLAAARWIEALLLGPLATSIAVVCVASIGLLMLTGRVNVRRGLTVIMGCFILFGAGAIAQGLRGGVVIASEKANPPVPTPSSASTSSERLSIPPMDPPPADPYAGASLRR